MHCRLQLVLDLVLEPWVQSPERRLRGQADWEQRLKEGLTPDLMAANHLVPVEQAPTVAKVAGRPCRRVKCGNAAKVFSKFKIYNVVSLLMIEKDHPALFTHDEASWRQCQQHQRQEVTRYCGY